MRKFVTILAGWSGCGYLAIRIMTSVILLLAGYNKLFNMGLSTVTSNFEKWGVLLPQVTGPLVSLLELIGGIMLLLGLFTRYVAVLFIIEFIVAAYIKWVPSGMNQGWPGARIDLMILFAAILFATNGGGKYSVDSKIGQL